ncbi:MAG: hypothetical protein JST31_05795 [Actinobacteria bacterium]|nr:hypothetical protein [Actinomycetota bacterium]
MNARNFRTLAAVAAALLGALALAAPASAAPANDQIAGAQVLPEALPVSVPGTTVGATGEAGEKVYSNEAKDSVWFSWKASVTGTVVVDLCGPISAGSSALSAIGVYTGSGTTWASLTKVTDTAGPCKLSFAATSGTTYKIQVDFLGTESEFVLGLHLPQPPANDNFAAAKVISGLPFSVSGSTIEATYEAGEPGALGGSGGSRSVWYSWTAPSSGQVQLEGCPFETQRGSAANMVMAVYTGATLAGLSNVVETNNCKVQFNVVAGTNYKIAFSGQFSGEGTFTLAMRSATPPSNDNFAAAQTIGPLLPLAVSGDNSFATTEVGESAIPIGGFTGSTHSVWYQWTPTVTELVKLNACGNNAVPRLGVYEGATLATLKVANLPLGYAPFCAAELQAKAGTTYRIAIAGSSFEGSTGPFELEIHAVSRPPNDAFAAAQTIGPDLPIAVDGSNADATIEAGEVSPAYGASPIATVWYRWQPSFTGPVVISTCGSATDDFAAVHTNTGPTTLTRLVPSGEDSPGACPDRSQKGAQDRFAAVAGTIYWIQVSSPDNGIEGPFQLTITDPNAKPPTSAASPPPAAPRVAPRKPLTLAGAIAQCRKRFAGKGKRAKAKRAACITGAKRRFALARCHRLGGKASQERCVKAVRKRFR